MTIIHLHVYSADLIPPAAPGSDVYRGAVEERAKRLYPAAPFITQLLTYDLGSYRLMRRYVRKP